MAASSSRPPHGSVEPSRSIRNPSRPSRHSHQTGSSRRQEKRAAVYEDEDEDDGDYDDDGGRSAEEDDLVNARFHRAVDIIQSLPKSGPITTTYEEKLMLYSCYKQGEFRNLCSIFIL